ncbi:hypothetical protein GCM10010983_15960 [Caulobacter rhizosphaerae]|nr:hypothetical protein GCM10010983_15960 [Caulobacter rhizosphaerae]
MLIERRLHRAAALVCLGLSLMSCGAEDPTRVRKVRNLVEARWPMPPLALRTLTVKGEVRRDIEGIVVRDLNCRDLCDNVLSLEFPNAEALDQALQNKFHIPCMVLKVKPLYRRSENPAVLGSRYRIRALEFVDVVDANSCPRDPGDHPLGALPQQPR